jgi:hypothetical protein
MGNVLTLALKRCWRTEGFLPIRWLLVLQGFPALFGINLTQR